MTSACILLFYQVYNAICVVTHALWGPEIHWGYTERVRKGIERDKERQREKLTGGFLLLLLSPLQSPIIYFDLIPFKHRALYWPLNSPGAPSFHSYVPVMITLQYNLSWEKECFSSSFLGKLTGSPLEAFLWNKHYPNTKNILKNYNKSYRLHYD